MSKRTRVAGYLKGEERYHEITSRDLRWLESLHTVMDLDYIYEPNLKCTSFTPFEWKVFRLRQSPITQMKQVYEKARELDYISQGIPRTTLAEVFIKIDLLFPEGSYNEARKVLKQEIDFLMDYTKDTSDVAPFTYVREVYRSMFPEAYEAQTKEEFSNFYEKLVPFVRK